VAARGAGGAALEGWQRAGMVSPGVGLLGATPLGPLRVDVAYDPSAARELPVLRAREDGGWDVVGRASYDPYRGLRDRLRLQVGMGLPF
jgi:hypothetical protein